MVVNILKNEFFTLENITTKRPGNGISPMLWNKVLGKKAKKNFNAQKVDLAKNITPVNKQRSIATNVDTDVDDGPQFIPMPMGSGKSNQSGSNASGSPAGGDSGIPTVAASNSMFRSYQLVAKKHFQVV